MSLPTCCRSRSQITPSGVMRRYHAQDCPHAPGAQVATLAADRRTATTLRRQHDAETARAGVEPRRRPKSSSSVTPLGDLESLPPAPRTSLRVWMDHPMSCACHHCAWTEARMEA